MKFFERKKNCLSLIIFLVVFSFQSCIERKKSNTSSDPQNETKGEELPPPNLPLDGSNIEGHYQAKFSTINKHLNGTVPGSATFYRKDDQLLAYVRLFSGGVKTWHRQHVYTGKRCPNMGDDENEDGFIDIVEAEKILGHILIPLDANITSQMAGRSYFPIGDLSGSYFYERITSFEYFFDDLRDDDENLEDNIIKISKNQGFDFEGLTILIQGVIPSTELPDTVRTIEPHKNYQTLPIACGVYRKVTETPGQPYDENVPTTSNEDEETTDEETTDEETTDEETSEEEEEMSDEEGEGEGGAFF